MTTIHTYQYADDKVVPTTVTCETTPGIGIHVIGFRYGEHVKESLMRTSTALTSLGYRFPGKKTVITVSPANLRSMDSLLDCAIAVALAKDERPERQDKECCVVGELDLSGGTRCGHRQDEAIRSIAEYHAANSAGRTLLIPEMQDIPETEGIRYARNIAEILKNF